VVSEFFDLFEHLLYFGIADLGATQEGLFCHSWRRTFKPGLNLMFAPLPERVAVQVPCFVHVN